MKYTYLVLGLMVILTSCSSDDEGGVPSNFNFQVIAEIEADLLDQGSGLLGSTDQNSVYVAHRSSRNSNAERIIKIDLTSNSFSDRLFSQVDFVTKRMHVQDNGLVVVGGTYVNTYNLNISETPQSVEHGLRLTRFGSFMYDNEIYIFGGDLDIADADKIKKWNESNNTFETVATLPERRFWTNGEVVAGKLYIFGGQQDFANGFGEDEIYIVDLEDFSIETMRLPEDYNRVFVTTIGDNIFVAGQVWRTDEIVTRLGYFDTINETFQEVSFNLDDDGVNSIFGLTSVGNRLFALHRVGEGTDYTLQEIRL